MRQVQLREEDEQLSSLVNEVEAGESVTILRSGRPVAQIIPFPEAKENEATEREAALARLTVLMEQGLDLGGKWNGRNGYDDAVTRREAAIRRLDEIMDEGIALGGTPPTRDEMHDGR